MELVRCFVAVAVGEAVARALLACQGELKASGAAVKWTAPGQLHLTLKFLGEVPPATVAAAREALAPVFAGAGPFTLHLAGLGAFPGPERPQVIWAGVREGSEALVRLAAGIDAALVPVSVAAENRPFRAHLTLGRVRERGLTEALVQALRAGHSREFGHCQVGEAIFMRSQLTREGPIYTPLATFALRGESGPPST